MNNSLPRSNQIKILGITLDPAGTMTLNDHIGATYYRSPYSHIKGINSIRHHLNDDTVETLTQSLMTSHIE